MGRPVQKQQVLSVKRGVLVSIDQYGGETDEGLIDLSHCTIVPPFIDVHLSLEISGSMDEEVRSVQENGNLESLKPTVEDNIHNLFSHGVLAVRTGSDRNRTVTDFINSNPVLPIEVFMPDSCRKPYKCGAVEGREELERMATEGMVWFPALAAMKVKADILGFSGKEELKDVAREELDRQLNNVRLANELGVTIGLGTDSGRVGVLHGESMFEEMKLLVKGGCSLVDTVKAATGTAAELLGIDDWGTLSVGKKANFLVARGAPSQMPRKFSYLEDICIEGESHPQYRKNPFKHVA